MRSRSWSVVSFLIVMALLLSSCQPASQPPAAETPQEAPQEVPQEPAASTFSVALITPNPLGDRSFIDSSARGMERAREELGVRADIIETQGVAEHEAALRGAILQGYDLVLGLAIDAQLFVELAEEFPDQKFGAPSDVFAEFLPDNLAAYTINVHESSFLVGLIAGMMSESKTVGAVVGGDAPGLNQFYYAYKQGVLEACPDCNVLVSYLGFDFSNPTLGLETALHQYDQGADIIYQIAGRSGEGVISAAAERGLFAIGVDSNQDFIQPGHVIVSMIKRVDITTYRLIESTMNDQFVGGFSLIGMGDGAAGLSWDEGSTTFEENGPSDMVAKLPEVKEKVEEYRTRILSGELEVCDALNETAVCEPLK
jgi:basic membrane protein A and related proteins